MSITKTLFDATRKIPSKGERGWSGEGTKLWSDTVDAIDGSFKKVGSIFIPYYTKTNSSCSANGTLTQVSQIHKVIGTPGAVILSATTAIADGSKDGVLLILQGRSDANTVKILDGANVALNGHITLGLYDVLVLCWDSTLSLWVELSRTN